MKTAGTANFLYGDAYEDYIMPYKFVNVANKYVINGVDMQAKWWFQFVSYLGIAYPNVDGQKRSKFLCPSVPHDAQANEPKTWGANTNIHQLESDAGVKWESLLKITKIVMPSTGCNMIETCNYNTSTGMPVYSSTFSSPDEFSNAWNFTGQGHTQQSWGGGFDYVRHQGVGNVLFWDGHVESRTRKSLPDIVSGKGGDARRRIPFYGAGMYK